MGSGGVIEDRRLRHADGLSLAADDVLKALHRLRGKVLLAGLDVHACRHVVRRQRLKSGPLFYIVPQTTVLIKERT